MVPQQVMERKEIAMCISYDHVSYESDEIKPTVKQNVVEFLWVSKIVALGLVMDLTKHILTSIRGK